MKGKRAGGERKLVVQVSEKKKKKRVGTGGIETVDCEEVGADCVIFDVDGHDLL